MIRNWVLNNYKDMIIPLIHEKGIVGKNPGIFLRNQKYVHTKTVVKRKRKPTCRLDHQKALGTRETLSSNPIVISSGPFKRVELTY